MADNNADSAVVHGIIGLRIEERLLEDCCREADLVGGGVVVGVHRLGSHAPFGPVRGLSKL